jgi:nicotinate-nucleotide adenylyltransferase
MRAWRSTRASCAAPARPSPWTRCASAELGPAHPIACLIGADAFRGLSTWHRWHELFLHTHLVALTRPGHRLDQLPPELEAELGPRRRASVAPLHAAAAGCVLELEVPAWDLSSTDVRAGLAQGRALQRWVPQPVLEWIAAERVYPQPVQAR